jgi:hypothetical protein
MSPKETTATATDPENPIERRASRASRISSIDQQDEENLAQFGYKQELKRDWGLMHNFGISFSIIVSLPFPAKLQQQAKILFKA